jgi:hypothetical protein
MWQPPKWPALQHAVLALMLALSAFPAAAQTGEAMKQVAVSGMQSPGGHVPLRVLLVISDAARSYRVRITFFRIKLGACLASKAENQFTQEFSSLKTVSAVPTGANGLDNFDLVVVVDNPRGEIHMSMRNTNPMTLAADFLVRNRKGEELFRAAETVNEDAPNVYVGCDHVGEALSRKFLNDLLASPQLQALLAPKADTDTPILGSAGLDEPPPAPSGGPSTPSAPTGSPWDGRP